MPDAPATPPGRTGLTFSRRPHRAGDDAALLELLRAAFGRWPKVEIQVDAIDHLRWKLSSTPDSPGLHRITEVDGEIASSVFCWVQRVKVRDRLLRNIQGTDRAVHPDLQRRGLAEEITRWRREHPDDQACDFQFGPRSGHPAMLRMFDQARQTRRTVTIANRIRVLTLACRDGNGAPIERPTRPPSTIDWSIRTIDRFDDRIDTFWQRAAAPFDFIVERTADYLNWRYADPRAGIFAIRVAEQGNELLGYSVLRLSHDRGYIADLLALPDRLDVAASLFDDAIAHFDGVPVARIDCWLPVRHPYQPLARERGFVDKRVVDIDCYIHNPALDLSFLADPSVAIHLSAGDTDLV
jgi:hypothetical protein